MPHRAHGDAGIAETASYRAERAECGGGHTIAVIDRRK
jgi:hypothetical protein